MLEIFNNKQKRELGKWGQWGNLSAELFPGVPELSVSQSKINVNENYNCTCICKALLSLQNLSAGVKCQHWQISSAVFYAVLYYSDSKLKELGCSAVALCSDSADTQLRCWDFFGGEMLYLIPLPRRWLCIPELGEGGWHPAWESPVRFASSPVVICCIWTPLMAVLSAPCSGRQLPACAGGSLQAWLHISTRLSIRSTFWMNFALVQAKKWHLFRSQFSHKWGSVFLSVL